MDLPSVSEIPRLVQPGETPRAVSDGHGFVGTLPPITAGPQQAALAEDRHGAKVVGSSRAGRGIQLPSAQSLQEFAKTEEVEEEQSWGSLPGFDGRAPL